MAPLDPRLLPHLRPAARSLVAAVAGSVTGGILVVAQAFLVTDLVVTLLSDPGGEDWHTPAWWLVGIGMGRALAGWLAEEAASSAADTVAAHLREGLLDATFALPALALSRRRTGELALLGTRGVAAVQPYLTRYLPALVVAGVLPVLTVVAIGWADPWTALIVLLTLPLVPVFAALVGMATRDRADRQWRTLSRLSGHFLDVVRGLPTLLAFNRAQVQSDRIREITERYRRATMDTLRLAFASSVVLELVATISVALVAVFVGLRLAAGHLDLRTALVVLLLAPEAYWPLRRVGAEFHAAAEGTATFEALDRLLTEAGAGAKGPGTEHAADDAKPEHPAPLDVQNLRITYPGRQTPALEVERAHIPAAGLTAVTGPSGCGKTTLLKALLGELPIERGIVTLAGEPREPQKWRRLVAQTPQTPWLTPASIGDNVRLGDPDATDEQVWEALAATAMDGVVAGLQEGLETRLGEDGAGLSAGQRARLAMARVVLADRPYVLLDEPTAHLDSESEEVLLRAMSRLAQRSTVVVVAHRPAVVAAADRVLELAPPSPCATSQPCAHPKPSDRVEDERVPRPATTQASVPPEAGGTARTRWALAVALGALASMSGVALTATAGWLIARAAEHPPVLFLTVAIVGVRTFGLARPALRYAERLVSHDVALRLLADRRAEVYDSLVPLVPARLGRRRGDLLATVVDDVDAVVDQLLRVRLPLATAGLTSVLCAAAVTVVHPAAVWPMLALSLLAGVGGHLLARRGTAGAEREFVRTRALLSERVEQTLGSARQLLLWQADAAARGGVRAAGQRLAGASRRSLRGGALGRALVTLAAVLTVPVMAWTCRSALQTGTVSGPMVALLLLVPLALGELLGQLPEAGTLAVRTRAAAARLEELAATPPAVDEPEVPGRRPRAEPLRLERVSAGWNDSPVLTDLSMELTAGERLTVTGPSGCGKSTLAAVLVRYLQPMAGSYTLDGTDAARLGSLEVRRHVLLIDDEPYVFASTLRENLRLAAPDARDPGLLRALGRAGLGTWTATLPDGLDTMLGEGGSELSGGERARLGLARAELAAPDVLVLDEPVANLDSDTAQAVTETVLANAERTLVWIGHDPVATGGDHPGGMRMLSW